jgi:capsid protein
MFAAAIQRDVDSTGPARNITVMATPQGPSRLEATTAAATPAFARLQQMAPGTILDRLAPGEKIQPFSTNGSIEPIDSFVNSHLKHMAAANGMSPEVYLMEFNKSFSAAQAANNEQRLALTIMRERFSAKVLSPIYEEWLFASALNGKIDGNALIDASFDPLAYDKYLAWIKCEWAGHVKPVVDIGKVVPAYATMVDRGWLTNERACRELTGMKFDDVQIRLLKENLSILKVNTPLAELGLIKGAPIAKPEQAAAPGGSNGASASDEVSAAIMEISEYVREMAN